MSILIHGGWPLEILGKGVVLSVGCKYERCLYLDADLLLHQSLDHLFIGNHRKDENHMIEIETVPDYLLGVINSNSLDTSQRDKHQIVVNKTMINSGVILYKPNRELFIQYIRTLGVLAEEGGVIQNDQDILTECVGKHLKNGGGYL